MGETIKIQFTVEVNGLANGNKLVNNAFYEVVANGTYTLSGCSNVVTTDVSQSYRIDHVVPTRLYGDKVYKITGALGDLEKNTDYTYDSTTETYTFTKDFLQNNCPYEEIFDKDITYTFNDTAASSQVKTVTTGTDTRTTADVTYDLYAKVNSSAEATTAKLKVTIYDEH